MRRTRRNAFNVAAVLAALVSGPGAGVLAPWGRENFEKARVGEVAPGFRAEVGRWVVVALPEGGRAFAQTGESPDPVFNVALESSSRARNVDMMVRLRAEAGRLDQGGGLVWRARDAKNYYVARFNPLEENFRVYKVVDGKRTQLQSAEAKRTPGWRTLRVRMEDDHILCELDGRPLLDVKDSTFTDAGMFGLWTKSDAQTQFDDLMRVAFE